MSGATEQLKEQVGLAKRPITILDKLESMKPQIAMALPRHLTPERMVRIAITCLRTNPDLAECDPQTILASVMLASQLGLEPGVMGQSFLIPYKKTCTLVPGWLGILDLVNRAGKATAWTGAVYAGDEFDWSLGDSPFVRHKPCGDESKLTHVYAIARVKGSSYPIIEVWAMDKLLKHRERFNKVGGKHYSYNHFEMYSRKVVLLQVLKYVPRSIELATAFQLDASAEMGEQHLEIKDVPSFIDGQFTDSPKETPAPVEDATKSTREMCGSCEEFDGSHKPDCKHAQPAPQSTQAPTQTVEAAPQAGNRIAVKITKVIKRTVKPLRRVEVLTNNGTVEMSVWHEHYHPILDKLQFLLDDGSKQMGMAVIEFSTKAKDGKTWTNVEKILELDGVPLEEEKEEF